jgi:hypothetical protein
MALYDLSIAWDSLTPEQQKRLGMAAIAVGIGAAGCDLTPGYTPAYEAAQLEGFDQIDMVLRDAAMLSVDEQGKLPKPHLSVFGVRQCRACGCTDSMGCDKGCSWAEGDLCSACVSAATGKGAGQ